MDLTRPLARFFPTPRILTPNATGIDITDASVKWMVLAPRDIGATVVSYGQHALPPGVVENGAVKDVGLLSDALLEVKKELGGAPMAHAALPEEGAYVFSMNVPANTPYREQLNMVEFELEGRVPVPVPDTVYDFDVITQHRDGTGTEIGVVAFARDIALGYVDAFEKAGIGLLSLEVEARSIARAVSPLGESPVTLLVDAGKGRTGFAILKNGIPIFTSTVDVGGGQMTKLVMELLSLEEPAAQLFKNEEGLACIDPDPKKQKAKDELIKIANVLADEVVRHYRFWDTRRNERGERVTPVEQVYIIGGSANLKGITDFIASKVHARTERPNVWRNVCSFDDYIPPIDRRTSLQYPTAIGLALRGILTRV